MEGEATTQRDIRNGFAQERIQGCDSWASSEVADGNRGLASLGGRLREEENHDEAKAVEGASVVLGSNAETKESMLAVFRLRCLNVDGQ